MLKVETQPGLVGNFIFSSSKKATGTFSETSEALDTGSGNMNNMKGVKSQEMFRFANI